MSRINRVAAVAAMLIAAATLRAQEYNETVTKKLTFHGGRVSIEHRFGKIEIRTHSGNVVDVKATIRASSAEIGRSISVATTDSSSGVSIITKYPEGHWTSRNGDTSYSVDYEIEMPANAPLTIRNRFGNIA